MDMLCDFEDGDVAWKEISRCFTRFVTAYPVAARMGGGEGGRDGGGRGRAAFGGAALWWGGI